MQQIGIYEQLITQVVEKKLNRKQFYNSKRRHGSNNMLPSIAYENQFERRLRSV